MLPKLKMDHELIPIIIAALITFFINHGGKRFLVKSMMTIRIWIITLLKQVRLYADYEDSVNKLTSFVELHKSSLSDYVYQSIHQIFFVSMNPNCIPGQD